MTSWQVAISLDNNPVLSNQCLFSHTLFLPNSPIAAFIYIFLYYIYNVTTMILNAWYDCAVSFTSR